MEERNYDPLVWVKDNAGNMFLCPYESLRDPSTVSDEQKRYCVDDATRLDRPETVPGKQKLHFSKSVSLS
jgi:hypothetical protein